MSKSLGSGTNASYPRPRVLIVMLHPSTFHLGGGQITTAQIALHLGKLGVDVFAVAGSSSVPFDPGIVKSFSIMAKRGFLRDTIGVAKLARTTNCNSIYAFTEYFPETMVPSFLSAFLARKKLFVNVTSEAHKADDAMSFFGLIRERVRSKPGFRSLLAYATSQASRRLACRLGTCLVASHYMERYATSLLHARRTHVVGRGVDEVWFRKTSAKKTYDGVYSGRFDSAKRVSTLVQAWQGVVAAKPDAKLMLIGDSGAEFPVVERMVRDLGLSTNVTFGGFVKSRIALAEMVRSARIFIFPSVKEGFGLVVAEAMAAGLPCVLSDITPLREVYGGSAVFVSSDQPSAFADAIIDLLFDQGKYLDYSARSLSLARRFSWDEVAKNVLSALTDA